MDYEKIRTKETQFVTLTTLSTQEFDYLIQVASYRLHATLVASLPRRTINFFGLTLFFCAKAQKNNVNL